VTEIGANTADHVVSIPGGSSEVRLSWAAATDIGRRRAANEDSYIARSPIFAVADGMGGHLSGDLASAAVVNRLDEEIKAQFVPPQLVERALDAATADIGVISGNSAIGVGTTVTGAVLTLIDGEPHFAIFNIGDSRVYSFEKNELRQVTVDHSLVQELIDAGTINKAQASKHPDGNIITRAVGFTAQPSPDFWMVPLHSGLRLLVCSDGLTGELDDKRIRLHMAAGLSVSETASALVDASLASGGRDNVTVIVIEVIDSPRYPKTEVSAPRTGPAES
jgi:PPM family protein phosphatase